MPSIEVVAMYLLERAITHAYWKPTQDYLRRRIKANRFREIGGTGVIEVHGGKCITSYVICDEWEPIGWIYLKRRRTWAAWEVAQTFVLKDYRGNGYAERLYKTAINVDGVLLASGCSHTKFSMGLWKKFIKNKTFEIWAHDFRNVSSCAQVIYEDGEVLCALPLYHSPWGKQDVRLIASRRV